MDEIVIRLLSVNIRPTSQSGQWFNFHLPCHAFHWPGMLSWTWTYNYSTIFLIFKNNNTSEGKKSFPLNYNTRLYLLFVG